MATQPETPDTPDRPDWFVIISLILIGVVIGAMLGISFQPTWEPLL